MERLTLTVKKKLFINNRREIYNVKGDVNEIGNEKLLLKDRFNISSFNFKHLRICISSTIIFIYMFSFYDLVLV